MGCQLTRTRPSWRQEKSTVTLTKKSRRWGSAHWRENERASQHPVVVVCRGCCCCCWCCCCCCCRRCCRRLLLLSSLLLLSTLSSRCEPTSPPLSSFWALFAEAAVLA